eukprot:15441394-Alexandrium_andersonii.AAC.1
MADILATATDARSLDNVRLRHSPADHGGQRMASSARAVSAVHSGPPPVTFLETQLLTSRRGLTPGLGLT